MIKQIKLLERIKKNITLIYDTDDEEYNPTQVLKDYLDEKTRIIRTRVGRIHGA